MDGKLGPGIPPVPAGRRRTPGECSLLARIAGVCGAVCAWTSKTRRSQTRPAWQIRTFITSTIAAGGGKRSQWQCAERAGGGEAEPMAVRAVQVRERVLGPEHPDTLSSVNNLATLYESQGRYAEAEPLHRRAPPARGAGPGAGGAG